jgi:hypothetical protein
MVGIWGAAAREKINMLQVLQSKCLKKIRYLTFLLPSILLYSEKVMPIKKLRELDMILTAFKIVKGQFKYDLPIKLRAEVHRYASRSSQNVGESDDE